MPRYTATVRGSVAASVIQEPSLNPELMPANIGSAARVIANVVANFFMVIRVNVAWLSRHRQELKPGFPPRHPRQLFGDAGAGNLAACPAELPLKFIAGLSIVSMRSQTISQGRAGRNGAVELE